MVPLSLLRELYEYNYWARDRQLDACSSLTPEQFVRPLGSSFSSVRDTLVHLLGAEWIWLERWHGRSPRLAPQPAEFPTLAAIEQRWREVERELRVFLVGLTAERLQEPLNYTNLRGEPFAYPLWQTLLHLANHQTYHRGQVTTLLRQLGVQPPAVDYLRLLDARRGADARKNR